MGRWEREEQEKMDAKERRKLETKKKSEKICEKEAIKKTEKVEKIKLLKKFWKDCRVDGNKDEEEQHEKEEKVPPNLTKERNGEKLKVDIRNSKIRGLNGESFKISKFRN